MTDAAPLIHLSTALADLVAKAAPSVVSIRSHRSQSTGFAWRPGLIVTADEALSEDGEITVAVPGGDPVPAQLVGRDPATDVAVLRIDRPDLPAVSLTAKGLAIGGLTIVVGSVDGTPVASFGVVSLASGPWRSLRGGEIDARIELDLRLRRSAEGGIALDASGAAFGMAVFGPRRRVLVIPAATIERVADKLASHGRIPRGYLGLGLHPVRLTGAEGMGAMVMSVDPNGPGAAAGVHQGDVIVAFNGEPIRPVQSLMRALGPDRVGQTVTLDLRRAGETKQLSLTIGERPPA
ncbi:MAG TPA: S1C family serine protease [Casimicrobiaceae bacterium]|nr:S1C family serine protease [Casimicrobiaceae bacterium]